MQNKISVILISHGNFAKETKNSVEMIVGKQNYIESLSLNVEENLNGFYKRLEKLYKNIKGNEGTIVFCDILGGTPSNSASKLLLDYPKDNIKVYTGLNLITMLELSMNIENDFSELNKIIEDTENNILKEISLDSLLKNLDEEEGDL